MKRRRRLAQKYPPSEPCACEICASYCIRPGWWTIEEAAKALDAGYGGRMMLEMSPELTFGVLSPAFRGCEVAFASNRFADMGCNFLNEGRCELHGTGYQPLECRYCHHDRRGLGDACHADIGKEWDTPTGRALVEQWVALTGFMEKEKARRAKTLL